MTTRRATLPPDLMPEDWRLGRYVVRFKIAQGGMGAVYLAQLETQGGFRKWVALKTIDERFAKDRSFVRLFLEEARLTARIDHPNVCTVFDFGEERGTYYLAMEYLAGESLNALIRRAGAAGGVPIHVAARILADAARGLHAAHELRLDDGTPARVVHRDISPQNIFVLYDGIAKIVDFGVASTITHHESAGMFAGKRAYMSPEQLTLQPIDRRSDLWSLGVVLWESTVGHRLFRRETDEATDEAVLRDPIPGPRVLRPDYPTALEAVVRKALARDPSQRFQTAAEMARALDQYLAGIGEPSGVDEVREVMHTHFGERMHSRELQIRARAQDPFGQLPDEEPTRDAQRPTTPPTERIDVQRPRLGSAKASASARIRRALGWVFTFALIAAMVAGALVLVLRMPESRPPPPVDPRVIPLVEGGLVGPGVDRSDAGATPAVIVAVPVRAPRPPANAGFLTIRGGRRGGYVSEGSARLGTLPLQRLALAPGRHTIRVETGPGPVVRTLVVYIRQGAERVERFPDVP
jgi:serine/threonine protein kinase